MTGPWSWLDHEGLEKLHQLSTLWLKDRNDEVEMQKIKPGWKVMDIYGDVIFDLIAL
jgi:hypothetical protein